MESIPKEVHAMILERTEPNTLRSSSRVCKNWRLYTANNIARMRQIRVKSIHIKEVNGEYFASVIKIPENQDGDDVHDLPAANILKYSPVWLEIALRGLQMSIEPFPNSMEHFPNGMGHFSFRDLPGWWAKSIPKMSLKGFTGSELLAFSACLTNVEDCLFCCIRECSSQQMEELVTKMPNVKILEFSGCSHTVDIKVGDQVIQKISENCMNLRALTFKTLHFIASARKIEGLLKNNNDLIKVELTRVVDENIEEFAMLQKFNPVTLMTGDGWVYFLKSDSI